MKRIAITTAAATIFLAACNDGQPEYLYDNESNVRPVLREDAAPSPSSDHDKGHGNDESKRDSDNPGHRR